MVDEASDASSLLIRGIAYVAATLSLVWHKITQDGTLAAAGRQGIDELGSALKAFPDSIQSHEVGTIWSPTQGEIAAGRADHVHGHGMRSPSEIAERGSVYGHDIGGDSIRSPSEIAADRSERGPERDGGQEHANDNQRELGHDR